MDKKAFKHFIYLMVQDLEYLYIRIKYCALLLLAMVWLLTSLGSVLVLVMKNITPPVHNDFFTDNVGYILIVNLTVAIVVWVCERAYQAVKNQKQGT